MKAPRAYANTEITFGLVTIPVGLISVNTDSKKTSFKQLHTCGTPVKQQLVCPYDGEVIEHKDVQKGYEWDEGYVVFDQDELKLLTPQKAPFEVDEFVPAGAVPARLYRNAYYLLPKKGASRPYALLAKVLAEMNVEAVGRYVTRNTEYAGIIRAANGGLELQHIEFEQRTRRPEEAYASMTLPEPDPDLIELAHQLVDAKFREKPMTYTSVYDDALADAVLAKAEARPIVYPEMRTPKKEVGDLMDQIKKSLGVE